jgi:hypothetical protein
MASWGSAARPTPASPQLRVILPIGDSITKGFGDTTPGAWRLKFFELAFANGATVDFVGSQSDGPDTVSGQPFPKNHEGYNGNHIAQVEALIPSPALDDNPEAIFLHTGTPDLFDSQSGMATRLASLLDTIIDEAPDAVILVCKIVPCPPFASGVTTYNAGLTTVVNDRIALGKHLVLVDMFTDFPVNGLQGDDVHPNDIGNDWMGEQYYAAFASYL